MIFSGRITGALGTSAHDLGITWGLRQPEDVALKLGGFYGARQGRTGDLRKALLPMKLSGDVLEHLILPYWAGLAAVWIRADIALNLQTHMDVLYTFVIG